MKNKIYTEPFQTFSIVGLNVKQIKNTFSNINLFIPALKSSVLCFCLFIKDATANTVKTGELALPI